MASGQRLLIDGLQYVNWTRELFEHAQEAGLAAIHVTVSYWENTAETLENLGHWRRHFQRHGDLIMPVLGGDDVREAVRQGKVGIVLGAQNCSPIEDDLKRVGLMHELGLRIMQLSYNNQSLLATGCYERRDSGITRFGREVIREMNRVGMIVDMSHSAERSTLEAIELSGRPIAITHANPASWHPALRNKSDRVLAALAESGGMLGLSLYPFHLAGASACTLESFCAMVAATVEKMGIAHVGIGSDLCLNWNDATLEWMRSGRWAATADYGEGSADDAGWPAQPAWFENNDGFANLAAGLASVGFDSEEVDRILGLNWLAFFDAGFGPAAG